MPRKSEIEQTKRKNRMREQIDELYTPQYINQLGMAYIKGNLNLKDLSIKHGISLDHIYVMSRDNKWAEAKREYRSKLLKSTSGKAAEDEGKRLAVLMDASTNLDNALLRLAASDDAILTAQDAQYMARALRDAVLAKRNLYNLPTLEEQARIDSAAGRLKIEADKLELIKKAQSTDSGDESIVVRIEGDSEDLAE